MSAVVSKTIIMFASIDILKSNACTLHVSGIANGFCDLGHSVRLYLPKAGSGASHALPLHRDVEVYYFGTGLFYNIPNALKVFFAIIPLYRALRKKPDLFYARFSLFNFILMAMARFMKVPSISEHNGFIGEEMAMSGPLHLLEPIADFLQILDCKLAGKIRVVTHNLKLLLKERGISDSKIIVAGNGTDLKLFHPMDRLISIQKIGLDKKKKYIGFIGTLAKWQGVEVLIEAYAKIAHDFDDWDLIVAGSGSEESVLKELAHQYNLENRIFFTGHVSIQNVPILLNTFSIGTSPAIQKRNATIGVSTIKIRDYSATGLPIVASRVPGNEELERKGVIMGHESDNPQDLSIVLKKLMLNEGLRIELGSNALKYAGMHFKWIDCCRHLL